MDHRKAVECRVAPRLVGQKPRDGHPQMAAVLLVVTIAAYLLTQSAVATPVKEVRRVLILNLLEPLSSPGVALLDQAIVSDLKSSPYQIELYTENLETTLFPDEASQQEFRKCVHPQVS